MYKIILFLVTYLPFQIALNPIEGIDLASVRIFILLFFLFWLASGLAKKSLLVPNNWQTGLLVSFLLICLFSVLEAKDEAWSIRKILFLFSIFPIYFVSADVINSSARLKKICQILVISGTMVAGIGIIQFFLQFIIGLNATYDFWANNIIVPFLGNNLSEAVLSNPSWLVNIGGTTYLRATSTFPDPHMLAFYLGLLVPLALGVLLEMPTNKKFWIGAVIILIFADLLTFSRGGYLGLLSGSAMATIVLWRKIGSKYKIAGLVILGLVVLLVSVPSPLAARLYSSFNLREGSNVGRLETWSKASAVVMENPLLGVGIGNYPLEIKPTASYREPIYAHNTYLDIAAETGIINALFWIGMIVLAAKNLISNKFKNALFPMSAVSLFIFSIHSLVETGIYSPTVLTLFLIILSFGSINKTLDTNHASK